MGHFGKVFKELNLEKIKYLVVGGVAVNLHGFARFTGDIDILLLLEKENLSKMAKAMDRLGYTQKVPVSIMSLADKDQVKKWLKEKGLIAYSFMPPNGNPLMVDVLTEESFNFEKSSKNKVLMRFDGVSIPIVSIGDLIKMKKKANRAKDIEDLKKLIKLRYL